jgi:hypothetical protein
VRVRWDPHPAFIGLPVWPAGASQAEIDAYNRRIRDLYASYADSLDEEYPLWHFEILTVRQPAYELAELAQQRRDGEGKS